MALSRQEFKQYIRNFNFRELFNEMGWDRDHTTQAIVVDGHSFNLTSAGQKSGFKILVCSPDAEERVPDSRTRKKIEVRATRLFPEHLIIFCDAAKTQQIWQWVSRAVGRPSRSTETRWNSTQDPEALFQKASGISFKLDEEDHITIVDVTWRIEANFDQNNERVTKRFYEVLKQHHASFYSFVEGIDDHIDEWNRSHPKDKKENRNKQWFVSLMLNRLMFCYFIQKKGFLDKNRNYLRDKLKECRERHGDDQYYSFYKSFLLALFHDGLGNPIHSSELKEEIGRIPYLNGGLFDTHELERQFADIEIKDEAFESIFEFFDQYNWHLDTTENASGRDINPDVIGYIFEKYINERAAMGAYYTKEDITDYISKYCILPFLFDETKRHYRRAFQPNGEIWSMLRNSGDTYIYDAVKKGVDLPLPDNIEVGVDTTKPNLLERRADWNRRAPEEYALPTEIWREVIDRRRRYNEAKTKIESGEITEINDFITYYLNIRQFAVDCVQNTIDPKFLEHFYKSIAGHIPGEGANEKHRNPISILDPTCGSGAFLFAALNILFELYDACTQKMEGFVEEEDRANAEDRANFRNQYAYFRRVLAHIKDEQQHPNRQYFIYKSIILNNLYGVDIMKEAVEIAKLRLFLKLVATVDADYRKPNLGLEPLPDIDFNIRAGNTLVGFANQADLENSLRSTVEGAIAKPRIEEQMELVSRVFARFKNSQVTKTDFQTIKDVKAELFDRLRELNNELDHLYHQHSSSEDFDAWRASHQPFHWLAEFYEIIHDRGGFTVVIGNPPYLELNQIKYQPRHLHTFESGAVHCMCIERSLQILRNDGYISMIVPLAIVSTQRMQSTQQLLEENRSVWFSNYSWRPGKLFDTVNRALTIFVSAPDDEPRTFANNYQKWNAEHRDYLLKTCFYNEVPRNRPAFWVPKLTKPIEVSILAKCLTQDCRVSSLATRIGNNRVYYRTTGGLYWKVFTDFPPAFRVNGVAGTSSRETTFQVNERKNLRPLVGALSSNTFWWWYTVTSNLRDLNPADIQNFPLPCDALADPELWHHSQEYLDDLIKNSSMMVREQRQTGRTETQSFKISKSKPIIDEIDKVLAKHYGFTEEELDFIINYDIKYRMGAELDGE